MELWRLTRKPSWRKGYARQRCHQPYSEPDIASARLPTPKTLAYNRICSVWLRIGCIFARYSPLNYRPLLWPWNWGSGSLKVIESEFNRVHTTLYSSSVRSKYASIYRFRRSWSSCILVENRYPLVGLFGASVGGEAVRFRPTQQPLMTENYNDGLLEVKEFRFAILIQITRVTDGIGVAYRLYTRYSIGPTFIHSFIYFCIVEVDKRNCDKCENNKIYRNAELRKLRK